MAANIVTLKTHLLQSVKEFCASNQLDPNRWAYNRHTGEPIMDDKRSLSLMFTADVNEKDDPDGYIAELDMGEGITLPAGRILFVDHQAGYVSGLTCTLPLETISFDESMELCLHVASLFEAQGFKPWRTNTKMTEREFAEKGGLRDQYGYWKLDGPLPMKMVLEVKNFNRMPTTSFTTVLREAEALDAHSTYLVDIDFGVAYEVGDELSELRKARYATVDGNKKQAPPVKVWFDDPDWRPEGWHGKWVK